MSLPRAPGCRNDRLTDVAEAALTLATACLDATRGQCFDQERVAELAVNVLLGVTACMDTRGTDRFDAALATHRTRRSEPANDDALAGGAA